ncbi:expressed protein, partial [Phakopsora pachyrhizi]
MSRRKRKSSCLEDVNHQSNRSIESIASVSTSKHLTPAERLTRADDLMSDVLDCCLWPTRSSIPIKRTIKFTPNYRRPRGLNINDIKRVIASIQHSRLRNITEATTLIRQLPAVESYVANAEPPRLGKHIGLYLQLFQSKCGVKFCETNRYDEARLKTDEPTQDPSQASNELSDQISSLIETSPRPSSRGRKLSRPEQELKELNPPTENSLCLASTRNTRSGKQPSPQMTNQNKGHSNSSNKRIHLAVFATRDYIINDIITGCEGSFADLTEEEDLKLRCNAQLPLIHQSNSENTQSSSKSPSIPNHREDHFDFSHLVNSRGKFQVFCGPARFVNHDCQNNVELLREGFTIKFKVVKPIKANEEILTSYGANYFGEANCECMCATCERENRGFYCEKPTRSDSSISSCSNSNSTITTTLPTEGSSILEDLIKQEPEEPTIPQINSTDTELTSLLYSSEGPETLSSETPVLNSSPSLLNTKSSPRSSKTGLTPLLQPPKKQQSRKHPHRSNSTLSRSSSLRRLHMKLMVDREPTNRRTDLIPVSFLPTAELTSPLLSLSSLLNSKEKNSCTETNLSQSEALEEPPPVETQSKRSKLLPIKRKTYWITTKQRESGILPWERDSLTNPLQSSQPTHSSFTTPISLSETSKRHSIAAAEGSVTIKESKPSDRKRRASHDPSERQNSSSKLPFRSYWISTKQKELGILPWEASSSKSVVNDSPPEPSFNRSTRSSRKAIEGVKKSLLGAPCAPRGMKLSYKVFEQGTEGAELLNTAIGRELLGFRPRRKKNKLENEDQDKEKKNLAEESN